jgi:predicted amidohydrolase YtcJ
MGTVSMGDTDADGADGADGVDGADGLVAGPVKLVLSDHALPGLDALVAQIRAAHERGAPVGAHSVTRESLLLYLAALDQAGHLLGDRVEHGALIPAAAIERLAQHQITVVTQPGLLTARGDDYLVGVDAHEHGDLWRYGTLRSAGVPVAMSSDAPYGPADPWGAMRSAAERSTPSGQCLGLEDRVSTRVALDSYLAEPSRPGGPARRLDVGAPADLVVLDCTLEQLVTDPDASHVVATVVAGEPVYLRDTPC